MNKTSYRHTFALPGGARNYDENVYAAGTSAEMLWRTESAIIHRLASDVLQGRRDSAYLDFACGTGRILSLLENLADIVVGVDISGPMLDRARAKCKRARLVQADLTISGSAVDGEYDLITSFRFLTNAEHELRVAALTRLRALLKDSGVLIVNTHSNPWSYRAVLLPYHWLKDVARGRRLYGYLSNREAIRLLKATGFRVKAILGMGFVPEKLIKVVPNGVAAFIEEVFAAKPFIQAFGLNQIFVCEKDPDWTPPAVR